VNKLKKIYLNNLIVQFLLSYTIVLILPLIILVCGFRAAFNVTEQDISESNITMLSHSKSLLDIQFKAMESKALQISQNPRISDLAEKKKVDSSFIEEASAAIGEYYNLIRYQEVNIVEDSYIYMNNSDYVIYQNALYKLSDFENSIKSKNNLSLKELKDICANNKDYVPYYTNINGNLQYIKPFATEMNGDVVGVIIFNINEYELKKVLNFDNKSNKRSVFIYNNDRKLIWSEDLAGYEEKLNEIDLLKGELIKENGFLVIKSNSKVTDWSFIVAIPEDIAMEKLTKLKNLSIILIFVSLALGIGLAAYLSVIKGRPINEMFNIYIEDRDMPRNFKNLGGIVSKIVSNNQALLQEIELEKPMLQRAFLNKLVKGDFINEKELNILAQKVGIELDNQKFSVVSFRLFLNNDLYEVDSQTLEEVQVLNHLIQKQITQRTNGIVWFYEKDYLTTLAIFNITQDSQEELINILIKEVHDLILKEYSVDSTWGISNICNNILELWRASEEAKVATINCKDQSILKYSKELEEKNEMYYPELFQEKIINSIRAMDTSNVDSLIDILQTENYSKRKISRKMLLELHDRIMLNISTNFTVSSDIEEKIDKLREIIHNNDTSEAEYFKQLKSVCCSLCKEMQKKKTCNQNKLIQRIVTYINEQYMNSNLGLALVASNFNISEGYVSTIFKGNMGVNFTDYVETVRIDCACKLLENSDDIISIIAEKVGYNSVQSFRRAFKKVKGISPKELRKKTIE